MFRETTLDPTAYRILQPTFFALSRHWVILHRDFNVHGLQPLCRVVDKANLGR